MINNSKVKGQKSNTITLNLSKIITKQVINTLYIVVSIFRKLSVSNFPIISKRFQYYFKIWLVMTKNSFKGFLSKKSVFIIFLTGKVLRFIFFLTFLYFLLSQNKQLAGYTLDQTIFFYLTFIFIDSATQMFFREVYRFRPLVVNGDLDLILVKPYKTIFRVLMGGADVADLFTLPPLVFFMIYIGAKIDASAIEAVVYILLLISSFVIAASMHIFVLAMGIITYEIDHSIMIYRDFTRLATLPTDIYREPVKSFVTYFIPVGIMITIPAKVFIGMASFYWLAVSIAVACILLFLSLRFWNFALKKYSSASS